jgi:hypothetical protein
MALSLFADCLTLLIIVAVICVRLLCGRSLIIDCMCRVAPLVWARLQPIIYGLAFVIVEGIISPRWFRTARESKRHNRY